jgi:hypothetical protein
MVVEQSLTHFTMATIHLKFISQLHAATLLFPFAFAMIEGSQFKIHLFGKVALVDQTNPLLHEHSLIAEELKISKEFASAEQFFTHLLS